jgi:predicted SnoaL-like aldol condensation-catalyzing enzyme
MKMSRIESAIRLALEFNKAFNRRDVAGMMQFISDDCIFENAAPAPEGAIYAGKVAIAQFWQNFFHSSPQAHTEIEDVFGLGPFRCVMRWKCNWIDSAGEKRYIRGVDIFKVRDDLICEQLSYVKGAYGNEQISFEVSR